MQRVRALAVVMMGAALLTAGCTTEGSDRAARNEPVTVAVAYDVGGSQDQAFNDAAKAGVERAELDFAVVASDHDAVVGERDTAKEERLRQFAAAGNDLVIGVGASYAQPLAAVAPQFPDTHFAVVDGQADGDNVASLLFADEQGSYLVGTIAGQASTTGRIGFVGGVDSPQIERFLAGYAAGARAVTPTVVVDALYLASDESGFTDIDGATRAAASLYAGGADIVFHAAGLAGMGVFEAADEAKALAIGVDTDQFVTAPDALKPVILTSMVKRLDTAVYRMIESVVEEDTFTGVKTFDLAMDGVGYATSNPAVTPYITIAEKYRQQIVNDLIAVPTAAAPTASDIG